MTAAVLARSLELALHFAVLGGLADIALQLHYGRLHEAVIHTVVASVCIVVLAGAAHLAKKFLGKD